MQSVLSISRIDRELFKGDSRLRDSLGIVLMLIIIGFSPRDNQRLANFMIEKQKETVKYSI